MPKKRVIHVTNYVDFKIKMKIFFLNMFLNIFVL